MNHHKIQNILNVLLYGGNFYSIILLKKKGNKVFSLQSVTIPDFPHEKVDFLIEEISELEIDSNDDLKKSQVFDQIKKQLPDLELQSDSIKNLFGDEFILLLLTPKKCITHTQGKIFENVKEVIIDYLSETENKSNNEKDDFNFEKRLSETLSNIEPVLYSSDVNSGQYYFLSASIEKIIGASLEDINSSKVTFFRSIHPEDFGKFKEFVRKVNKGEKAEVEYKYISKLGNTGYVRQSGVPITENKNVVRVVGLINDITKEKELLAKLISSELQYNILMKTSSGLLFILDRSGYFISINDRGSAQLGYQKNNIIGSHFLEFIDEDSKANIAIAFQKILSQNHPVTFEANFTDNFGKTILFEIQASNLRTDNKISGMIGSGHDITDRKVDEVKVQELNSKLTEANRIISIERDRAKEKISVLEELNTLKNDFISNVSHEFRTPLASIVGFAETISTDHDLPKEVALEFNNIILNEGKRLAKLINDILDFSKLEDNKDALSKTTFDLILLVKELIGFYKETADKKGVSLENEIPESEIIIEADMERIRTSISNLISNAIKFTNKDGRVTIIVQEFLNEVEILIIDTGIGIPEEKMPLLFQKFSKVGHTQTQGAGFGLVTVKKIIDLHKGLIQVKSEPGNGTTFIIRLPKQIK